MNIRYPIYEGVYRILTEEAQKQGQEQDGSQQQPHAPVQVAGKPRKKEEASQQAEKKPRTRKPSITPKM